MVNISMCYNNPTILNMYWYYRKLVYKFIVNGGGYRIYNSFLLLVVVTPMCISLDLWRIRPDGVYIDEVYDHTKLFKVVCMLSMDAYIKYMVILIIYTTVVSF